MVLIIKSPRHSVNSKTKIGKFCIRIVVIETIITKRYLVYRLPYADLFGGVIGMSRSHFQLVNGFSNMFWGWGGEDDDMASRVKAHDLNITRYRPNVARYHMLTHAKQKANPKRYANGSQCYNQGLYKFKKKLRAFVYALKTT